MNEIKTLYLTIKDTKLDIKEDWKESTRKDWAQVRILLVVPFERAYLLSLLSCRKGNWTHVGSNPTARAKIH